MQNPFMEPDYKKNSLTSKIIDNYHIDNVTMGRDKTMNIFVRSKDTRKKYYIKWYEHDIDDADGSWESRVKLEQAFAKFLLDKFVLTGKTPHINRYLDLVSDCENADEQIELMLGRDCPPIRNIIGVDIDRNVANPFCVKVSDIRASMLSDKYDLMISQYGGKPLYDFMDRLCLSVEKRGFRRSEFFRRKVEELNRIYFQMIFTIAVIKEQYPGYIHGNLFSRNIVVDVVNTYSNLDYLAYHINGKIFYTKCNGPHAKMIDFEESRINKPGMDFRTLFPGKKEVYYPTGPDDEYFDMWSLLGIQWYNSVQCGHDCRIITHVLEKFLNMDISKDIAKLLRNPGVRHYVDSGIQGLDKMESFVKKPMEYLESDIFDEYTKLPDNARIIYRFNEK